jgi:hypothetical protein
MCNYNTTSHDAKILISSDLVSLISAIEKCSLHLISFEHLYGQSLDVNLWQSVCVSSPAQQGSIVLHL